MSQQDRQSYNYALPSTVLTPASVGTYISINTGVRGDGWVLVFNESPFRIQVLSPSLTSQAIQPQSVDKIRLIPGDQVIQILPTTLLTSQNPPSSKVDVQVYPGADNEPAGQYPMSLSRQTNTGDFIGSQQVYAIYENTFTTAAGTHTETLPTPPAGQAMYIKRIEVSSGTVGAAAARIDMQLGNTDPVIVSGFPSWEAQVAANAGLPLFPIDFPGPVKGVTSQAMTFSINAPTGTFCALNVYYFFQ